MFMADKIPIKIKFKAFSPRVFELRTVVKGRFFKREYIGYSKKEAVKLFEKWLSTKL